MIDEKSKEMRVFRSGRGYIPNVRILNFRVPVPKLLS